MSASLVGSEMCIRDRDQHLVGHRAGEAGRRSRPTSVHESSFSDPSPRGCLLYTSDAADDM
eukprot:429328-Alexandrium_andersonii.AAC.1